MAEVHRRSEAFKVRRKERRKKIALACLPVLICCGGFFALVTGGFGGFGVSSETAAISQNAAVTSDMCVEAPAAAAEESGIEPAEGEMKYETGSSFDAVQPQYDDQIPENFDIRFVWAIGAENVYDTYIGQIQKDLVLDGIATADFEPDEAVLEQIYRKLCELDIASIDRVMTSKVLTSTDEMVACIPLTTYEISFTMNDDTYTVKGDETAAFYPEDDEAVRFMKFVNFMSQIIRDTPEYQALPEANGAYE